MRIPITLTEASGLARTGERIELGLLDALARVAALEWAKDGIRVNTIHPNAVYDTALWTDEVLASRMVAELAGNYSSAFAPLLWEGEGIGTIGVLRQPPRPFSAKEIALERQLGITPFLPWIKKTVITIVFVFGVLMIAQSLGADVKAFLAGLGIGGLAFALAAQDTIANLFGSVVVAIDQPFKIGEAVQIGATTGVVEDIGLRSTRIRLVDSRGKLVITEVNPPAIASRVTVSGSTASASIATSRSIPASGRCRSKPGLKFTTW
mgnify:CR=1 FL=1